MKQPWGGARGRVLVRTAQAHFPAPKRGGCAPGAHGHGTQAPRHLDWVATDSISSSDPRCARCGARCACMRRPRRRFQLPCTALPSPMLTRVLLPTHFWPGVDAAPTGEDGGDRGIVQDAVGWRHPGKPSWGRARFSGARYVQPLCLSHRSTPSNTRGGPCEGVRGQLKAAGLTPTLPVLP